MSAKALERPRVTLVVGMAGSGKSSVTNCLKTRGESKGKRTYTINLDPAVKRTLYDSNIDIRDTIDYTGVREKYNLGPNGAILTACNLFATRFDQVITLCEQRSAHVGHIIVDTPGQIEIFTWSASGSIICEAFAASFPTTVLFVIDTPRVQVAQVFMSNMLQCLSMVYKTKLPVVLAFNKTDITSHDFANLWLRDMETFHAALGGASSYAADLAISLVSTICEFYSKLSTVGISATTENGFDELFEKLTHSTI
jgi:GTPase SAR1 family protein|uniref:GPN-loop GTPase n=1 Tax=Ostreococcus sp. 'lucimarinus' TaxID=242159 RepID=A0A7R9T6B7_9CHLO|tara:strand:- start:37522 stop:38283 length:762 start_codon:yes stop_codon:yes gene_type:complete|mmetsp:Transcript_7506/g.30151  ORF Transcript_7506/g.30151 Transcript_7506/m.30151 type:complete len:254 (+) Transcript_7506:97-858(+)